MRWAEVGQLDRDAVIDHTVAQYVDGAPLVDLGGEPSDEFRLCAREPAVAFLQMIPRISLGRPQERKQIFCVNARYRIEGRRASLTRSFHFCIATVLDQPGGDVFLECCFVGFHRMTSAGLRDGLSDAPNDAPNESDVNKSRNGEYR